MIFVSLLQSKSENGKFPLLDVSFVSLLSCRTREGESIFLVLYYIVLYIVYLSIGERCLKVNCIGGVGKKADFTNRMQK
jgi:hypothetical protein